MPLTWDREPLEEMDDLLPEENDPLVNLELIDPGDDDDDDLEFEDDDAWDDEEEDDDYFNDDPIEEDDDGYGDEA